jgi:FtsP/CotA-like multicopper oxidase with cupredoxin domain
LDQPVTLSWQGVRGPNAMDGVAGLTQAPVKPGESFETGFTPPDSGMFWYHSHVWPHTAEQTGRGLYGVLIVDEPEPPPSDEEVLIVLDDWSLDAQTQIKGDFGDVEQARHGGRTGPLITVNSHAAPLVSSMRPGSRVRLRLLNACNARILAVTFAGTHPQVQAIDGQPCEIFEPVRQTLPVGPGARFDVMIDLPSEAGKEASLISRWEGEPDQPLLVLKTEGEPRKPREPAAGLPANPALPAAIPLERAFKMDLVIDGGAKPPPPARAASEPAPGPAKLWTINGVASDGFSGKPLFRVKRGGAVSLAFINKSAFPQQMQVRGHALRLLHDLDDGWEPYWRDAVLVAPGRTKHVAFIADNPGKWAIESLVLERQVTGLAGWFEVG